MGNIDIETLEAIMNVTVYVFVFLFGITIGSFLNVCILRLPKGESLVTNNSHCMTCGTEIKRYDLIPVFSWLILGGKCRACGAKISPRYMLVEALTGFLFLGIFIRYDFMNYGLYPVMLCLFTAGLVVLCFQDIDNQEMCVSVLVYTGIIAVISHILSFITDGYTPILVFPETNLRDGIYGMLSVSLLLLVVGFVITPLFYSCFISEDHKALRGIKANLKKTAESDKNYKKLIAEKEALEAKIKEDGPVYGFGMGDVVLMAAGGLMLGLKATVTAGVIAIVLGAVYGVIAKYARRSDDENSSVFAFGPFLIIGLVAASYLNGMLADMYLNTLFIPR